METKELDIIRGLMDDVVGIKSDTLEKVSKDDIKTTIENIFKQYNLSTDTTFVSKIASIKLNDKGEKIQLDSLPSQLQDAAFLPVNTIADIALRQDLDLVISQIPEWFTALQITRDAICESDVVTGRMARNIVFDRTNLKEEDTESIMTKIDSVEERLDLDSIIKNHIVFNTLEYGEGYIYAVPYAKVFQDLYKFKSQNPEGIKRSKNVEVGNGLKSINMFQTTQNGYGYSEGYEVRLSDTFIQEEKKQSTIFTESEMKEIWPVYHDTTVKNNQQISNDADDIVRGISSMISYVEQDIALPVLEESAHDLNALYRTKYHNQNNFIQEYDSIFTEVMEKDNTDDDNKDGILNEFSNIRGVYLRILPSTKLIPIRIDREVIGYYYVSDFTKTEESGQRKNSGLSGYTLKSPSVGFDTFSPDQMFCERLATKIINNFDLKFMRNNTILHKEIVSILMGHKFNEAMLRFIFIPAEHVIQFTINKDGMGKGHSMLEPGLVTARMYMFLKLYSLLFQINNSHVRVYNLHMSGIDKDYKQFVQETMRKFAARRVTVNDIFNYRSSMNKVSGGSELIMPMGAGDVAPITFENIPAAEAPINNELLETLKNEAINSTPVPSLMVQTGGQSEIEFAKETELANTRFNTLISSCKIDFNKDITQLYRLILRWETDIPVEILHNLKYVLRMPMAKQLNVTSEMINNFNALAETATAIFLTANENKGADGEAGTSDIAREFKKLLLGEYIPQLDPDHFDELADEARKKATESKLNNTNKDSNIMNEEEPVE